MGSQPLPPDPDRPSPDAPARTASPDGARTRIDVPWQTFAKLSLAILITIGVLRFLEQIVAVLIVVTLALFLAAVLSPLAARLERRGLGRGLASVLSVGAAVLLALALLALVVPPLVIQGIEFANDLPDQLVRLRRGLAGYPAVFEALDAQARAIREDPAKFFSGFLRFGVGTVSTIASAVLILTLALYFLIDHVRIRAAVLRYVAPTYRERVDRTITDSARVVRAYFTGQAIVSSIFALLTFGVLTILGVPYASVLAAAAFFLDAIPNIGATLATVVPALVALTSEGLTDALIVVGVVMVYQQVENNLVSPRILGGRLEIPPVLTLISILVGGALLGVIGVILAIPLAGILPVIDRIWFKPQSSAPAPVLRGPLRATGSDGGSEAGGRSA